MAEVQHILAAAIKIVSDFKFFASDVAFKRFCRLEMTTALVLSRREAGFGARETRFPLFLNNLLSSRQMYLFEDVGEVPIAFKRHDWFLDEGFSQIAVGVEIIPVGINDLLDRGM